MSLLYSARRHSIRDCVEGQVHVLLEETCELVADKESLWGKVSVDTLPHDLLFAVGAEKLILRVIKELELLEFLNGTIVIVNIISIVTVKEIASLVMELLGFCGISNRGGESSGLSKVHYWIELVL